MSFESLSESYNFSIKGFPSEWLPLTYLYDPDLPLFPIAYFHIIDPNLSVEKRPAEKDRLFGFIHHINLDSTSLTVNVITNKKLNDSSNANYLPVLELEIKRRLGLENPVNFSDIQNCLVGELKNANDLIRELWYKVIEGSFGKSLPFGRMWDPVFGLARFVASWNSSGGRKGELISTHNFASEFGVKIQTGSGIHADFYLLPTFQELTDSSNPLSYFSKYSNLVRAAEWFVKKYCESVSIGKHSFSSFKLSKVGAGSKIHTKVIMEIMNQGGAVYEKALFENFSAFDRGPQRSIISLMMLHDLRNKSWTPDDFTPEESALLYSDLKNSYQTPKVIHLYSQLCFGNESALPIDNWVKTFLKWPFNFKVKPKDFYKKLFSLTDKWGKLERVIWIAAQSRKVHASVCKEILWCVRYGAPKDSKEPKMRGASPLACKICEIQIRDNCPAYKEIKSYKVSFNCNSSTATFNIYTTPPSPTIGQNFTKCISKDTEDTYSVRDRVELFKTYPQASHSGSELTVEEFIKIY